MRIEPSDSKPDASRRVSSMLRIAGVVLGLLIVVGVLEYLSHGAVAPAQWVWCALTLGFALAVIFLSVHQVGWQSLAAALTSVNLAVVLIAFLGLECTLGTLSLQKSDIESLPPAEQLRQFKYAEGSFLYHLFARKPKRPTSLDERSEAYYRLLSEKFGKDYGKRQRSNALAAQSREVEEKDIENFIAAHDGLLNTIFSFMQATGLFHAHTAWWFRLTLLLLCANLVLCTADRYKMRLRQTGFLLTHAGVLLILIGAAVGSLLEEKGMMAFRLGQAETADSFLNLRTNQPQDFGFTVQLANFKTAYHKELYVEFLDSASALPANAQLQNVYKVNKGKEWVLDGGRTTIRVLDMMPEAVLESKIVNLSQEPKNPAMEIRVGSGDETQRTWLFALDNSVYVDKANAFKIKYFRPDTEAALQSELEKAKTSSLGSLTLRTEKENKRQVVPLRMNEKIVFDVYTIQVTELRPDFRVQEPNPEAAPPLNPAVRLSITKGNEHEIRWVFQNLDFEQFHPSQFTDLKISLAMPMWEAPCRLKCLLVQKKDAFASYTIEDKTVTGPLPVKLQKPASIGKTGATFAIEQHLPDAGLERNVVPAPAKRQPHGPDLEEAAESVQPAVQLHIKGPNFEATKWLLANSKEAGTFEQPGYLRVAYMDNTDKMPEEWRSHLLFLDEGKPVMSGIARVNHPVKFRGYLFYQMDAKVDDPTYSGIQVVRDPSSGVVNLGLIAVIVGVLFTFYVKPYLKKAKESSG